MYDVIVIHTYIRNFDHRVGLCVCSFMSTGRRPVPTPVRRTQPYTAVTPCDVTICSVNLQCLPPRPASVGHPQLNTANRSFAAAEQRRSASGDLVAMTTGAVNSASATMMKTNERLPARLIC